MSPADRLNSYKAQQFHRITALNHNYNYGLSAVPDFARCAQARDHARKIKH